jgi:hypothetical protein
VDAPATTDRVRLRERQTANRFDVGRELFQETIDSTHAHRRFDRRIDEQVDVVGEAIEQPPALRHGGAALDDGAARQRAGDDAQDLAAPVVLLDEGVREIVLCRCRGDERSGPPWDGAPIVAEAFVEHLHAHGDALVADRGDRACHEFRTWLARLPQNPKTPRALLYSTPPVFAACDLLCDRGIV